MALYRDSLKSQCGGIMTNRRQARRAAAALILALGLAAALPTAPGASTTTYRYWTDVSSGMAMAGYDPVAYFVDGKPVEGVSGQEYTWRGATWRFASAANRAAFVEAPEVYAPQFGGYSVVGVARGYPSEGNPFIWAVAKKRLYLFHSPAHKTIWQQDPQRWIDLAAANWPQMEHRLVP